MKLNTGFYLITAAAFAAGVATATAQSAADLGKSLTPLGAEKAGNAAGTIPAWEGGITQPPAGYKSGDHHPDPFADDKPSATINAANAEQYADNLTEGHKALLARYASTYKMPVYPTRRIFIIPPRQMSRPPSWRTAATVCPGLPVVLRFRFRKPGRK